jgi:hypothetical protein
LAGENRPSLIAVAGTDSILIPLLPNVHGKPHDTHIEKKDAERERRQPLKLGGGVESTPIRAKAWAS